jgi:hypothetical protein
LIAVNLFLIDDNEYFLLRRKENISFVFDEHIWFFRLGSSNHILYFG